MLGPELPLSLRPAGFRADPGRGAAVAGMRHFRCSCRGPAAACRSRRPRPAAAVHCPTFVACSDPSSLTALLLRDCRCSHACNVHLLIPSLPPCIPLLPCGCRPAGPEQPPHHVLVSRGLDWLLCHRLHHDSGASQEELDERSVRRKNACFGLPPLAAATWVPTVARRSPRPAPRCVQLSDTQLRPLHPAGGLRCGCAGWARCSWPRCSCGWTSRAQA